MTEPPAPSEPPSPRRAPVAQRGVGRPSLFHRACSILVLSLVATVVVIALAEWGARTFCDAPVNPYTPHPYIARVRSPGFKQMKMTIDDPARPFLFEIDPLGFRGKNVQTIKKPAGSYRIFFVGASTTENQQLEEERTFPGIVERVLNERTKGHPRVEVANTGIVGYGIDRSFSIIAHQVLQLEPDLIVVNDGGIDMLSCIAEDWQPATLKLDAYTYSLKEWLVTESRLVALWDARFSTKDVDMRRRSFEKKVKIAQAKPINVPKDRDLLRGLPQYQAYLRRIALICEDAGVPLYFMTQATIWKKDQPRDENDALWMGGAILPGPIHLDPATLAELISHYNDSIREAGATHHAHTIDLAARVPKDLQHFIDDAHLTPKGNEVVADSVLDAIWKDGALPARVPAGDGSR